MLLGACLSVYGWVRSEVKLGIWTSILCGGLAGMAGAAIVMTVTAPKKPEAASASGQPAPTKAASKRDDVGPLLDRVRALENQISKLKARDRHGKDEQVVARSPAVNVNAEAGPTGGIPLEPSQIAQSTAAAIREDGSPVRDAVVGIIQDEIKNRRAEWRAYARARGEARDEDRLAKMSAKVDLSEATKNRLLDVMEQERKQVRALRSEVRETMDFKSFREKRKAIQQETNEGVADFLAPSQLEAWGEMRAQPRRSRWH